MASNATSSCEKTLANLIGSPSFKVLEFSGQILNLPLGIASDRLQEFIANFHRIGSKVSIRIAVVLFETWHHDQNAEHASPVPWVGAHIRIHPGFLGNLEAQRLGLSWPDEFAC